MRKKVSPNLCLAKVILKNKYIKQYKIYQKQIEQKNKFNFSYLLTFRINTPKYSLFFYMDKMLLKFIGKKSCNVLLWLIYDNN